MKWMIKGAKILHDSRADKPVEVKDILVDGNIISVMGKNLSVERHKPDRLIDGAGKLIMPGLVNAHFHSHDRFDIGRLDNRPLELWMALYNSPLGKRMWTPEEIYLQTALCCIEMLRSGTTMVVDDVFHTMPFSREHIEAVFQAYRDAGMRARVSIAYSDRPYCETIPYLSEVLPEGLKAEISKPPPSSPEDVLDLWRTYGENTHGRVQFIAATSAPQRCSDTWLKSAWALARELDIPMTVHVLETKVQAVTGRLFYKTSIVDHMRKLGILDSRTVLVHAVWLTDEDIQMISDAGASVVHNPVTNLKLGSGIAPVVKMVEAGVNVGLGTDNNNANDSCNMFESMKAAALLNKVTTFEYDRWLGAADALRMATWGGAACVSAHNEIGELKTGNRADMVIIDLERLPFLPIHNIVHQLVFCEKGFSVDSVVVDGRFVVEQGKVISMDEDAVIQKIRDKADRLVAEIDRASSRARELEPYIKSAYNMCVKQDVGFTAHCSE